MPPRDQQQPGEKDQPTQAFPRPRMEDQNGQTAQIRLPDLSEPPTGSGRGSAADAPESRRGPVGVPGRDESWDSLAGRPGQSDTPGEETAQLFIGRGGGNVPVFLKVDFPERPMTDAMRVAIILGVTTLVHIATLVAFGSPVGQGAVLAYATLVLCTAGPVMAFGVAVDKPGGTIGSHLAVVVVTLLCTAVCAGDAYKWAEPVLRARGWL